MTDSPTKDSQLALLAQALDIIGQLIEIDVPEDDTHAAQWISEGRRFFEKHAPALDVDPPPVRDIRPAHQHGPDCLCFDCTLRYA